MSARTKGKLRTLEEVREALEPLRTAGRTVALANGVFDLLHVGHVRYLEGARELADVLVVAVNSDASTRRNKGPNRPVIPEAERLELVAALACTDFVLLFDEPDVRHILRALRPDVHVKGTDYTPESIPERDEVLAYGGTTAVAGDPKDHSTTALAERLGARRGDELLSLLVCPQCKGALAQGREGRELRCLRCRLGYAVEDELPVMLVEEARALSDEEVASPPAGS